MGGLYVSGWRLSSRGRAPSPLPASPPKADKSPCAGEGFVGREKGLTVLGRPTYLEPSVLSLVSSIRGLYAELSAAFRIYGDVSPTPRIPSPIRGRVWVRGPEHPGVQRPDTLALTFSLTEGERREKTTANF